MHHYSPTRRARPGRAARAVAIGVTAAVLGAALGPLLQARPEQAPPDAVLMCGFGETCSTFGCHVSPPPGETMLELELLAGEPPEPMAAEYVPGLTYDLALSVTGSDGFYIGMELAAVIDCPLAVDAGRIELLESGRTTLTTDDFGVTYLTHRCTCQAVPEPECCGYVSEVLGSGENAWSFRWTAPEFGSGPVTFFMAFNEADGDGSRMGDRIVTRQLVFEEEACPEPIADLHVALAECDPTEPGVRKIQLSWSEQDGSETIRRTSDPALVPLGAREWSLAEGACLPPQPASLELFSASRPCPSGAEGPH